MTEHPFYAALYRNDYRQSCCSQLSDERTHEQGHPQLTGKLNTIGDNFVAISGNLKEVDYSAIFQKVDATLANVKMITEKLNSKDNAYRTALQRPCLYNNLNATTENAASFWKT